MYSTILCVLRVNRFARVACSNQPMHMTYVFTKCHSTFNIYRQLLKRRCTKAEKTFGTSSHLFV
jgi:hypothetical protein